MTLKSRLLGAAAGVLALAGIFLVTAPESRAELENGAVFTPEGTLLFHRHDGERGGIYEMDLDGNILHQITDSRYLDRWPSIGHGSRDIVFISTRDRRWSVYHVARAGGDVELLSDTSVFNLGGAISDSGEIVYAQNRDQEEFQSDILAYDPANGSTRLIIEGGMWPRWMSDTRFLFTRDNGEDGSLDVMMFDVAEQSVHRLTDGAGDDVSATLSPDGQQLYWGVQDGASYILHRRDLAGGEGVSLGVRMNIDSAQAISPDGRFMVFGRNEGNGYDLVRLDLATMEEVRLTGTD